jgi:hypothetical protein
MLHAARWLAVFLLAVMTTLSALLFTVSVPLAHAAGDTVALTLTNGTIFTYGGPTQPIFTVVVTLAQPLSGTYAFSVAVRIENGETVSSGYGPTISPDGLTLTFTQIGARVGTPFTGGNHTATATFFNPETSVTSTSNGVNFTINKAPVQLSCSGAQNATRFVGVSQTFPMVMSPTSSSGGPIDWKNGTYTVKFDGPTHLSFSNLVPNNNDEVTVTTPAQKGLYNVTCIFSGTVSYQPATFTDSNRYTVSTLHKLGTVELFTNPTTIKAGQKLDFYVVFHAAPGLPLPTGEFGFLIGQYYTTMLPMSSSGANLVHLDPLPSMAGVTNIGISYSGDANYNDAGVTFPLTNPPIPSGNNSGGTSGSYGGSGGGGKATPTTTATGTATTTETPNDETATPTTVGAGAVVTATPNDSGGNTGLIIAVAIAILLLTGAGAAAGIVIYRMRRASALGDAGAQASYGSPPAGYGQPRQYRDLGWSGQSGQYGEGDYGRPGGYGGGGASHDDETYHSQNDW